MSRWQHLCIQYWNLFYCAESRRRSVPVISHHRFTVRIQQYATVVQAKYTDECTVGDRLDHSPIPRPCSLGMGPMDPSWFHHSLQKWNHICTPWATGFEVSLLSCCTSLRKPPYVCRYCWTCHRRVRWYCTQGCLHCRRNTTRPSSPKTLVRPAHHYLLSFSLSALTSVWILLHMRGLINGSFVPRPILLLFCNNKTTWKLFFFTSQICL